MDKIKLIIAREYLSRVRKKSFIIMTILGPLLFAGLTFVPMWLATRESSDKKVIQIVDESKYFDGKLESSNSEIFEMNYSPIDKALEELNKGQSLIHIPKFDIDERIEITLYSFNNQGIGLKSNIQNKVRNEIEKIKLLNSGIEQEQLNQLKAHVTISTQDLSKKGNDKKSSTEASLVVGYVSAFLIYLFIFLYGAQTMRGVIEEKTSKVIEIIISSVRPFQLMMGKIVGIGAVGLTQFLLWVILSTAIVGIGTSLILKDATEEQLEQLESDQPIKTPANQNKGIEVLNAMQSVDYPFVIACFIFYFLGGFLLYGSLFAAIGSAVDSDADSQQFMLPITIPLIFSMVLLSAIIKEPHGSLAVWTSIIPFTSPVIMMMRIPFGAPIWQIALSMLSLVVGFLFTTWFAGRIYRIGIFMHGTKVNYKVLAKWFMMKI